MKKIINIVLVFLLISICTACGYSIRQYSSTSQYSYFINNITNTSIDLTITNDILPTVIRFFSDYGSLRSKENAKYIFTLQLEQYEISAPITSPTGSAANSALTLAYKVTIENRFGEIVYESRFARTMNFHAGSTIATYNLGRKSALDQLTIQILTEFKHAFENS